MQKFQLVVKTWTLNDDVFLQAIDLLHNMLYFFCINAIISDIYNTVHLHQDVSRLHDNFMVTVLSSVESNVLKSLLLA